LCAIRFYQKRGVKEKEEKENKKGKGGPDPNGAVLPERDPAKMKKR